jgi:hypothetical protein
VSLLFDALGTVHIVFLAIVLILVQRLIRKYPVLFIYCGAQLITSLVELVVRRWYGPGSRLYAQLFWSDELAIDLLLFLMVIDLTFRTMEGNPARKAMGRLLAGVVLLALALPFVLFDGTIFRPSGLPNASWFDHTSQLLNFGGAILNLGLWTALLSSRQRDPQLLMVSAGLGVAVTGAAISYGLRRLFSQDQVAVANLFYVATRAASAFIWCWAFRPTAGKAQPVTTL